MKPIIYQLLPRLFGNKNTTNKFYGSIKENGVGKFNDITPEALIQIKALGITHIWYTGILEHATMTDYTAFGISPDDPDVVKGRAGSPYAVKDYYDVDPDLAVSVPCRIQEFENLINRTHEHGMQVIIDFIPNHVARLYKSDNKPTYIKDLGADDRTDTAFLPDNNFYYLPNTSFSVPHAYNPGGDNFLSPLKDGRFIEVPAKATGNDVFVPNPSINDWFEAVKLNYGINYANGTKHFNPIPDTWHKMTNILLYWANKGVDGFRCDMCEMVPVEFWNYACAKVKEKYPNVLFIGEAYNPSNYHAYLNNGFDYLYDKCGLYDTLKSVMLNGKDICILNKYINSEVKGIEHKMLQFLENHDEVRIASDFFAGSALKAIPYMVIAATINSGAVMIYFGQECGVKAIGESGFSGNDGRTSIFDYIGVPEHQQWMNNGKFDGGLLTSEQKQVREFYKSLLNICALQKALYYGDFVDLNTINEHSAGFNKYKNYAFLRITSSEILIIIASIDNVDMEAYIKIPTGLLQPDAEYLAQDLLFGQFCAKITSNNFCNKGLHIKMPAQSALIIKIKKKAD